MINKKQNGANNANRKRINGTETKRYSKAKFKKDNGAMTLEEKKTQEPETAVAETKTVDFYREKFNQEVTRNSYELNGKIESVKTAILSHPSLQAKGYSVLPKGQCVTVTTFVGGTHRMVKANDGRVGIIPADCAVKSIF